MKQLSTSITDSPRDNRQGQKDSFGIEPYALGLANFISGTSTPITIALQGEWGSGKTSLMNSLQESLSDSDTADFHAVWLNTWEHALMKDAQSTLLDILTELVRETATIAKWDESNTSKLLNKLWNVGKVAAKFAAKTAANKVMDGSSEIIDSALSSSASDSSIGQIRNELEELIANCLEKTKKKGFIFFIDDLDRIDPPVAVQLLELLKNIFNLKKCVFVLAIDYDVVVKGLEPKFGKFSETNEREFRSFFDKIIQVPFSMPVASYEVNTFLKESLLTINFLDGTTSKNDALIAKLSEVASLSVGTNPRSLKRLINSLSLINCINNSLPKQQKDEEDEPLNKELELLVNFTLVSFQIAFPKVYSLLTSQPGFDSWGEDTAMRHNLKPLTEEEDRALSTSKEFDETWEKTLYRLCKTDHFLKKKALNISKVLNDTKQAITDNGENIEDVISSVISMSSVTSVEAFDKPTEEFHRGDVLKIIRRKLKENLQQRLPDIAGTIRNQGKRVQTNAYLKFTAEDWGHWIKLSVFNQNGRVRLLVHTHKWMCKTVKGSLQECITAAGMQKDFDAFENDFSTFLKKHNSMSSIGIYDEVFKAKGHFVQGLYVYQDLISASDFEVEAHQNTLADAIADFYPFILKFEELKIALSEKLGE
jgi:hypothetical protein